MELVELLLVLSLFFVLVLSPWWVFKIYNDRCKKKLYKSLKIGQEYKRYYVEIECPFYEDHGYYILRIVDIRDGWINCNKYYPLRDTPMTLESFSIDSWYREQRYLKLK